MTNDRVAGARILLGLALLGAGWTGVARAAYPTTIQFSGRTWHVKTSSGKVGPGPNLFSDSSQSVWVDQSGKLHLKIRKVGGRWYCSEVVLGENLGYGTYRFYLSSPVDALDPQVVLGIFTWSDTPDHNNRELDIEFSRWGSRNNLNAQYVVQPYTIAANIFRFNEPAGLPLSTHSLKWTPGSALFQSYAGNAPNTTPPFQERLFTNGVPPRGDENARINLWLYQGRAPTNKQEVEVVVDSFEFIPYVGP